MRRFFLVFLLGLLSPGFGWADTVILRSGERVEGTVISQSDKEVRVEAASGIVTVAREKISIVEQTNPTSAAVSGPSVSVFSAPKEALKASKERRVATEKAAAPKKETSSPVVTNNMAEPAAPTPDVFEALKKNPLDLMKITKQTVDNYNASQERSKKAMDEAVKSISE